MALYQVNAGDRILAVDNTQFYNILKGVAASGESITLIYNAAGALIFQPSSDPAALTQLVQIKNNAGTVQLALTSDGVIVLTKTASQIVPGATSFSIRNNANGADNVLVSDAGAVTVRSSITAASGISCALTAHGANFQIALSSTGYLGFGQTAIANLGADQNIMRLRVPFAGTLSKLRIETDGAQSGTGSLVFTVLINGVSSGITATQAAGGSTVSLSDTTHSATVAASDYIVLQAVNNATALSQSVRSVSLMLDRTA